MKIEKISNLKFRPDPLESQVVKMTDDQWDQFITRVGSFDCAVYWCERAEDYNRVFPKKWQKYQDHYLTLINWHRKRLEDGKRWFAHPVSGAGFYPTWEIARVERGRK